MTTSTIAVCAPNIPVLLRFHFMHAYSYFLRFADPMFCGLADTAKYSELITAHIHMLYNRWQPVVT